eukprot:g4928.t1
MTECVYNYVVTAQRPTAVTHSVVGHITGHWNIDLIIGYVFPILPLIPSFSKSTSIELYTLRKGGLQPVVDTPVNGRIAAVQLFRPASSQCDYVLLLTERYDICTLRFDSSSSEWRTISTGCLQQNVGQEARNGPFAIIDPQSRICGFHLYSSVFRLMNIEDGKLTNAFSVRMEELNILHTCFLPSEHFDTHKPVLALLYEDTRYARHLKTYLVDMDQQELEEGPWMQYSMLNVAEVMIPILPFGGLILLGESMISYLSNVKSPMHISVHETSFESYGMIDSNRYLLSDHLGRLYILLLITSNNLVTEINCRRIGEASPASTISYLDSGTFFIGSSSGDSQLIKLVSDSSMQSSPVKVLNTFTNLGPIIDFCVVDLERQGQCQVVTCSGAFMQGSLRIIRNGIGITDQATIELHGVKGLWSLKRSLEDPLDVYLMISFVNETRGLAFLSNNAEELTDAQINGFEHEKQTLHCANLIHNAILQVTVGEIRAIFNQGLNGVHKWTPSEDKSIIMATSSPSQVLLACDSGELVYFIISPNQLTEEWVFHVQEEISCLDITPVDGDRFNAKFAVVGTWEMNLLLVDLRSRSILKKMMISAETIPRSVLFSTFEDHDYLLVAMGDGRLITYDMDTSTGEISDEKWVSIGTKPVTLNRFWTKGTSHVFASSDRPTIIYGDQKKLMFSNLNESNVNLLTSFNTTNVPDCLALAKEGSLTIGNIDDIQKLHIRSIHLKEMPRRICHQSETKSFGVLTESFMSDGRPQSYFRVFDDETFEVKKSFSFDLTETGTSITSLALPDSFQDPKKKEMFYLVGTAFNVPTDYDPQKGRILVFHFSNFQGHSTLNLVASKEFKGAVFSIKPILDRILATVSSKVHVLEWRVKDDASKEIHVSCTQHCHILAVYSDVRSNFVIIGDLMRSISLLVFDPEKNELEIRSRDTNSNWMTAVKALDDDVYLGADNSYNLLTVKKATSAVRAEEGRLETVGQFHLGEFVNVLREGSLVAKSGQEAFIRPPVIFGTVNGQLGLILSLMKENFEFLQQLQGAMQEIIQPLGQFSHLKFRSFSNERRTGEMQNFIDGDLIETYLDLKRNVMEQVAQMMDKPRDEIYKLVEDLSKLH